MKNFVDKYLNELAAALLFVLIISGMFTTTRYYERQEKQLEEVQEIAEFACDHEYGNLYDDMTVEVVEVKENKNYGGTVICCKVYDGGKVVKYIELNKSWYQGMMK